MDAETQMLIQAVRDASSKNQVYAYNIANALTPGFRPVRLPEDAERSRVQEKMGIHDKVVIEEELSKQSENQSKRDSYLRLISMKRSILTQVIRQGK